MTTQLHALAPVPEQVDAPQVAVVVPVYNEQAVLESSIRRLHSYLTESFPFTWRVVIADNASSDDTLAIARGLAYELPGVDVLHLQAKGRGRALRSAWSTSAAEVVCYMDVDLSTDLRALLPLVAPLLSGHSDLAIGTRLARGAHVSRSPKRELISRTYNHLLHAALRAHFSDAQCGFKAARTAAVRDLLPEVRDEGWFFDTELLVLAERRGLRIHEVPVDWVEDPDSRVDIVSTALGDLRGVARLAAGSRVLRFVAIGIVSTLAYALLYLVLRDWLASGAANALALATTAVGNTAANRRLTFGVRGREGLLRQHVLGGLVFLLALGLTSGALAALHALVPRPSHLLEAIVLVLASAGATLSRYVCMRWWIFANEVRRERSPTAPGQAAAQPAASGPPPWPRGDIERTAIARRAS
jgi:glycosyltransferase involved in cell wall biosynthesis